MKRKYLVFVLILLIIPSIVFAWWNPFGWFDGLSSPDSGRSEIPAQRSRPASKEDVSIEKEDSDAENEVEVASEDISYKNQEEIAEDSDNLETPSEPATEEVPEPNTDSYSSEEIYAQWSPSVVRVYCIILDSSGNKKSYSDGSGFLTLGSADEYMILTTSHVFAPSGTKSDYCDVTFPKNGETYRIDREKMFFSKNYLQDKGGLVLDGPSSYVKSLLQKEIYGYGLGEKNCSAVGKGEQIAVIGYPVGSDKSKPSYNVGKVTSYQEPFYLSDATIRSGYSGGIAVSQENNCMFGILVYSAKDDLTTSMIFDIQKY